MERSGVALSKHREVLSKVVLGERGLSLGTEVHHVHVHVPCSEKRTEIARHQLD